MPEHFKVGERVRLLHESGEGVITAVLSPRKLEVMIDDFLELEVGTDEVVKIHAAESSLVKEEAEEVTTSRVIPTKALDIAPSFIILRNAQRDYEFWLSNQGSDEILYTTYIKVRQKHNPLESGHLMPDDKVFLGKLNSQEFHMANTIVIQFLQFRRGGSSKPRPAFTREISCKTEVFSLKPRTIAHMGALGYEFELKEQELPPIPSSDYVRVKETRKRAATPKTTEVIDLHIGKLVANPATVDSRTMLNIQLEHFENQLSDARLRGVEALVFIHGIGKGRLKELIHQKLSALDFISNFELADPIKYGNGATIAYLTN